MTTNIEVIGDALRLINVIAETQTPSPEQGSNSLRRLNQLIESWTDDGIELGYFAQDSTTDECPIPASAERAVTAMLALDLATVYGAKASAELVAAANTSYNTLVRKSVTDQVTELDMTHLPMGEGRWNVCVPNFTDE